MMGSGKTSIGLLLSKKLKLEFFDIDQLIEREIKTKISKIFETKGEKFFRNVEEKITLKILEKENVIISLGGGAFLNRKIRAEILNKHLSFWLKLDSKTLVQRIKNSSKRPVAVKLTNEDLVNLIKKRSHIYSKSLYKINCKSLKKFEIVNKILEYL